MNAQRSNPDSADKFDSEAAVEIPTQEHRGAIKRVAVAEARYDAAEFVVVVYDAKMDAVGSSPPVDAGDTFEGTISLDSPLTDTQTVTAILHEVDDSGAIGEYLKVNDIVVLDNATVGRLEFSREW